MCPNIYEREGNTAVRRRERLCVANSLAEKVYAYNFCCEFCASGGVLMAMKLKKLGHPVIILEKSDRIDGKNFLM